MSIILPEDFADTLPSITQEINAMKESIANWYTRLQKEGCDALIASCSFYDKSWHLKGNGLASYEVLGFTGTPKEIAGSFKTQHLFSDRGHPFILIDLNTPLDEQAFLPYGISLSSLHNTPYIAETFKDDVASFDLKAYEALSIPEKVKMTARYVPVIRNSFQIPKQHKIALGS